MKNGLLIGIVLLIGVGTASAEVLVEIHDQPLVAAMLDQTRADNAIGGVVPADAKSNQPTTGYWFIPHFLADKMSNGDSTYFSVRNESLVPTLVEVEYFDVKSRLQQTQTLELESRQVRSVVVRQVPNLPVDGDGYARGFIRISAAVPVAVDAFLLDTGNNFAVGGVGFVTDDFCTRWNARFLRFGAEGGSTLSMMINGPQGNRPADPVTVAGDVYAESGEFLASFTIRTDEWSIEVPLHEYAPSGVNFGFVELVVNSRFLPAGIVELRHQALGQFSVGHWAICID